MTSPLALLDTPHLKQYQTVFDTKLSVGKSFGSLRNRTTVPLGWGFGSGTLGGHPFQLELGAWGEKAVLGSCLWVHLLVNLQPVWRVVQRGVGVHTWAASTPLYRLGVVWGRSFALSPNSVPAEPLSLELRESFELVTSGAFAGWVSSTMAETAAPAVVVGLGAGSTLRASHTA